MVNSENCPARRVVEYLIYSNQPLITKKMKKDYVMPMEISHPFRPFFLGLTIVSFQGKSMPFKNMSQKET